MNNLVSMVDGGAMASSKDVAVNFGVSHKHVLDKINRISKDLESHGLIFGHENFKENKYLTERGRTYNHILMTRDGFTMVAMSLTGKKALKWKVKYIEAFNAMEKGLLNVDSRMQKLSKEGQQLKQAGSEWSKFGHEINRMKKSHTKECEELIGDVQFKLEFN